MPNTNCLAGLACPNCKQAENLLIEVTVIVVVTDNGIQRHSSHHSWDADSYCRCPLCAYSGALREFEAEAGEGGAS
jgi:hypothetical protein